jgi:hypothetical protein
MVFETSKEKGRAGLSAAIAYFGMNGYTVSIPLNDTQDYDLIVDKDGVLQKVSVKSSDSKNKNGNYSCSLRTVSGTSRKVIGTVKNSSADLLFCLTGDGTMFLFPIDVLSNTNSLILSKTSKSKFSSKNTLNTCDYIVHM